MGDVLAREPPRQIGGEFRLAAPEMRRAGHLDLDAIGPIRRGPRTVAATPLGEPAQGGGVLGGRQGDVPLRQLQYWSTADSQVDVPEPELAAVLNADGDVVGYTICNDMSSRSIEGENPLYLPQAKIYLGSCAAGPGIRPAWELTDPYGLTIEMTDKDTL